MPATPKPKPVALPETLIKVPAWSTEGGETYITATKRCLVTEREAGKSAVAATKGQIDLVQKQLQLLETMENISGLQPETKTFLLQKLGKFEERLKATQIKYTTADCPVYEIEKCAIPEADPGLKQAGVEVCAVVNVDESVIGKRGEFPTIGSATVLTPIIHNRIIVRPAGCKVVGTVGTATMLTRPYVLETPTGERAPIGTVECVHTAAYVGPLEGIANVSDEQLAFEVGTEAALPPDIRHNPLTHFGSLWSYVEGLLQEGIANVFQGAAGPGDAPVGFNAEMQKQMYQAIAKVAPTWAQNNLLPAILDAWAPHISSSKKPGDILEMLNEAFGLPDAVKQSPAIAKMVQEMFPHIEFWREGHLYLSLEALFAGMKAGELKDWTGLPIYGGEYPFNTEEIWSWDANRMIVGTSEEDVKIVARTDTRDAIIQLIEANARVVDEGIGSRCLYTVSVRLPLGEIDEAVNVYLGKHLDESFWQLLEAGTHAQEVQNIFEREELYNAAGEAGDTTDTESITDYYYRAWTFGGFVAEYLSAEKITLALTLEKQGLEIPECNTPLGWKTWSNAHLGTTFG